ELPTQIALGAVVICAVSVYATQKLDGHVKEASAQKNAQQVAESLAAKANPVTPKKIQAGLHYDYLPVGTVPGLSARNVILDPCLGRPK
ncbi:MAG: hypothetical protein EBY21_11890, partial [Alphaproteobacteria bacterium]|nr:hypothetical protein [Alphaproteobacteria bacterium]